MLTVVCLFILAAFVVFLLTYASRKEMRQKEKFISKITSVAIEHIDYNVDYQMSDQEKLFGRYGMCGAFRDKPVHRDIFYCGYYIVEVYTIKCEPFTCRADTSINVIDINGNKTTFSSDNGMVEYPTSLLINKFYPHRTFVNLVNDKNPIEKIMCEVVDSCQIIPAVVVAPAPSVVFDKKGNAIVISTTGDEPLPEGMHNKGIYGPVVPMVGYNPDYIEFKEDFSEARFQCKYAPDQYSYYKFYCGNYLTTVAIFKRVPFRLSADTMIIINTINGNNILVRNDRVLGDFKYGKTPYYLSAKESYPLLKELFKAIKNKDRRFPVKVTWLDNPANCEY